MTAIYVSLDIHQKHTASHKALQLKTGVTHQINNLFNTIYIIFSVTLYKLILQRLLLQLDNG